jgi:hypothetical protein
LERAIAIEAVGYAIAFTLQCRNRWCLERAIAIEAVGYAIAYCWALKSTTPTGDRLLCKNDRFWKE